MPTNTRGQRLDAETWLSHDSPLSSSTTPLTNAQSDGITKSAHEFDESPILGIGAFSGLLRSNRTQRERTHARQTLVGQGVVEHYPSTARRHHPDHKKVLASDNHIHLKAGGLAFMAFFGLGVRLFGLVDRVLEPGREVW
jgi:hypothetical protein